MLALKEIVKDYYAGGQPVHALKGVSINFRKNEFVSILGPSGCGKTTLLNIIGGLDHYTSGDLVINGKSTKLYKDRDWDVYRNHRIGFIFQSYNLIPHQTVLGNVELALTIAGLNKKERVEKAKKALDRVGLKDQYYKRPNQLSGGQCQRVAIARALVNDPEILLADEPTGALDTVTSVQIMDLIKEISAERLVIMVTHNPDLAKQYSTRIVRLLDGKIIEDTAPFLDEDEQKEVELIKTTTEENEKREIETLTAQGKDVKKYYKRKKERAKMSFFTAFLLSAKNLISKKGRTFMVGLAGSIGIIGIALVLAFSAGIKGYVVSMQDDMLSGNPITITEQTYDLDALTGMMDMGDKVEIVKQPNRVYVNSMVEYFIKTGKKVDSLLIKNNITEDYVNYVKAMPKDYYSAMKLGYGINVHNNLFTTVRETNKTTDTEISISALTSLYTELLKTTSFKDYAQYVSMFIPEFAQAPSSEDYIKSQYEVYGDIATNKNEIMLVINKEDELSDLLLARLGYYTQDEFMNIVYKADESSQYNENLNVDSFAYDDLLNKKFYWYSNDTVFTKTSIPDMPYAYNAYGKDEWKENDTSVELKVVGILKPKANVSYGCLSSGVYYTEEFTNYVLSTTKAETEGVLNYVNNLATENVNYANLIRQTTFSYQLSYSYYNDAGTLVTPAPTMQTITLANIGGMFTMMGGGEISSEDVKNSAIRSLGGNDVANSISIYPVDFDNKDMVTNYLTKWNENGDITVGEKVIKEADRQDVEYTDTLSLVIALINNMIDIVSYALIAFTSVSLVVSTVMIGIITYVSVVERIKEIGVIRSLGGRKKDVSHLFNAETFIIGLLAGLIGVLATYGISAIVNAILYPLIGIEQIAALPILEAIGLIILSVLLTSVSGLIPAKSAANKDPVIALRTE